MAGFLVLFFQSSWELLTWHLICWSYSQGTCNFLFPKSFCLVIPKQWVTFALFVWAYTSCFFKKRLMRSETFAERQEDYFSPRSNWMCLGREVFSMWGGALREGELSNRQKQDIAERREQTHSSSKVMEIKIPGDLEWTVHHLLHLRKTTMLLLWDQAWKKSLICGQEEIFLEMLLILLFYLNILRFLFF